MPFDPDVLVRSEKLEFIVEVSQCSLCPLSEECLDQTGDFTGIHCSVKDTYIRFPECCENVPDNCPLKKNDCTIIVHLSSKTKREKY
jgi:hypothetical protein